MDLIQKYDIEQQVNVVAAWSSFIGHFLIPLVSTEGARTYELFIGNKRLSPWFSYFDRFLKQFPPTQRDTLRHVIDDFFSEMDIKTKDFILTYLDAYFMVSASGLSRSDLKTLIDTSGEVGQFTLSVDTNFVYSILGLHDNPSNQAVSDLVELAEGASDNAIIQFVITEGTLDETLESLTYHRHKLGSVSYPPNLAEALRTTDASIMSGVYKRFFERVESTGHAISVDDYFSPYEHGLVRLLAAKGITVLTEDVDREHKLSLAIIEDIEQQKKFEKDRFKDRAKSERQITRDVLHWHFIQELRHRIRQGHSAFTAKYWIITVDFRFLSFDRFKTNQQRYKLPICIHPTQLIQLLRFFIPRSAQFEQTLLNVVRMPILVREFDSTAEQVSLRIVRNLARHEHISDVNPTTLGSIVADEALRQKVEKASSDRQVNQLIKDRLAEQIAAYESEIGNQNSEMKGLHTEIGSLKGLIDEITADQIKWNEQVDSLTLDKDKLQAELDRYRGQLEGLRADREYLKRRNKILKVSIIAVFVILGCFAIVFLPSWLNWNWFIQHPRRLGLTMCALVAYASVIWAVADSNSERRLAGIAGGLLAGIFGIAQLIDP